MTKILLLNTKYLNLSNLTTVIFNYFVLIWSAKKFWWLFGYKIHKLLFQYNVSTTPDFSDVYVTSISYSIISWKFLVFFINFIHFDLGFTSPIQPTLDMWPLNTITTHAVMLLMPLHDSINLYAHQLVI